MGKEMVKRTEKRELEKARDLRVVLPAVDIYETDDEILVRADMPGVGKSDVHVNIDNGTLSLSGVRRLETRGGPAWEEFSDLEYTRSFSVPQSIDTARVEAELKNGILTLHLPKSEAAKPRQIEIKAA